MDSLPKELQDIIEKGYREHYWWYRHIKSQEDLTDLPTSKRALYLDLFFQDNQHVAIDSILENLPYALPLTPPPGSWVPIGSQLLLATFESAITQHLRVAPYLFGWLMVHDPSFKQITPRDHHTGIWADMFLGTYWALHYGIQASNIDFVDYIISRYPHPQEFLVRDGRKPLFDIALRLAIRRGSLAVVKHVMVKDLRLRHNSDYLVLAAGSQKIGMFNYLFTLTNPLLISLEGVLSLVEKSIHYSHGDLTMFHHVYTLLAPLVNPQEANPSPFYGVRNRYLRYRRKKILLSVISQRWVLMRPKNVEAIGGLMREGLLELTIDDLAPALRMIQSLLFEEQSRVGTVHPIAEWAREDARQNLLRLPRSEEILRNIPFHREEGV